jgi:hypothetical protein
MVSHEIVVKNRYAIVYTYNTKFLEPNWPTIILLDNFDPNRHTLVAEYPDYNIAKAQHKFELSKLKYSENPKVVAWYKYKTNSDKNSVIQRKIATRVSKIQKIQREIKDLQKEIV